jgi:putative ABC transport system ATP-binding protein
MIATKDLQKVFFTEEVETHAINKISIEIEEGEYVALMGPSGCGKTTLLNVLGLLDKPSGGTYRFMDEDVSNYSENQRSAMRKGNIGFVFQSFNLIDELKVFENVALPLIYMQVPPKERQKRVMTILDKMNIVHRRNHFPQQLSGGQQQRVAIARAVVTEPKLILADEPTGNLDSTNGDEVMGLLENLHQEGTTIVMVTHSSACAEAADRIVHLLDGQIMGYQPIGKSHVA